MPSPTDIERARGEAFMEAVAALRSGRAIVPAVAPILGAPWTRENEELRKGIEAVLALHRESPHPATRGAHRGRHFCLACTVSVDDFTAYVDWPCLTARALLGGD